MVIWLRQPRVELNGELLCGVGVSSDGDIVRRETLATVVALDDALTQSRAQHDDIIAAAHRRAGEIAARAESDALALLEQAQAEYESAEQRGYEAGSERAISDWYRRAAQHAVEQRDMQSLLRERLAELVVVAVEQIIRSEDAGTLFARSTAVVDRIADGCSYLKVRVHPDDYEAATREFGQFAADWRERGRAVPVQVIADRQLAPGACVCESDLGIVDASLSTQLAAMRSAVERAVARELPVAGDPAAASGAASAVPTGQGDADDGELDAGIDTGDIADEPERLEA